METKITRIKAVLEKYSKHPPSNFSKVQFLPIINELIHAKRGRGDMAIIATNGIG